MYINYGQVVFQINWNGFDQIFVYLSVNLSTPICPFYFKMAFWGYRGRSYCYNKQDNKKWSKTFSLNFINNNPHIPIYLFQFFPFLYVLYFLLFFFGGRGVFLVKTSKIFGLIKCWMKKKTNYDFKSFFSLW